MNNFRFYVLGGANYQYDLASNATARKADDLVKLNPLISVLKPELDFNSFFPYLFFPLKLNSATELSTPITGIQT